MITKEKYQELLNKDCLDWTEEETDAMWEYHLAHPVTLTPEEIAERNKKVREIIQEILKNK